MSSRRLIAALIAATLSVAALVALAPAAGAGGSRVTNLGVTAHELAPDDFSLVFTRPTISPGKALVQLQNAGQDGHDLAWKKVPGNGPTSQIGYTEPETSSSRTPASFKPGKYRFWCTIADHRKLGMKATLTVKRR